MRQHAPCITAVLVAHTPQTVQEMKEKLCYVALDPTKERRLAAETTVLMEK